MVVVVVVVAVCPRNVWINGMDEHFVVNGNLTCGSEAFPTARYRWQIFRGSGFARGQRFVVDSTGFFNVRCTAYNDLALSNNDPLCSRTVYVTGYVPQSTR